MKYIISEDRLVKLVDKYITLAVGELIKTKSSHQLGEKEDFDLLDKNDNTIFQYFGRHLGVSKELFYTIMSMFNLNQSQTEEMFVKWFEKRFPDERVMASYYSIYY